MSSFWCNFCHWLQFKMTTFSAACDENFIKMMSFPFEFIYVWIPLWFVSVVILLFHSRDHSGYGLNQWEMTLHDNILSHWLSLYPEWSLHTFIKIVLVCVVDNISILAKLIMMLQYSRIVITNIIKADNVLLGILENYVWSKLMPFRISRLKRNYYHNTNAVFKCVFVRKNIFILISVWTKFPKAPMDNLLVSVMFWWYIGSKPLPEPMVI